MGLAASIKHERTSCPPVNLFHQIRERFCGKRPRRSAAAARVRSAAAGEDLAADYCRRVLYHRQSPATGAIAGEIDLICKDGAVWCLLRCVPGMAARVGGVHSVDAKKRRNSCGCVRRILSNCQTRRNTSVWM